MRFLLPLILISVAACGGESSETATTGTTEPVDLAKVLDTELSNLVELDSPATESVSEALRLVPGASDGVNTMTIHSGTAQMRDDKIDVRIGTLDISDQIPGAKLVVMVDEDGSVQSVGIDGVADSTGAWENFVGQFGYKGVRKTLPLEPAHSTDAAIAFRGDLRSSTDPADAKILMAYEHERLMRGNSQLIRQVSMGKFSGDFFRSYVEDLDRQNEIIKAFESAVGENGVREYAKVTAEASNLLQVMAGQADNGNASAVSAGIKDYRRKTCGACHGITEHNFGDMDLDDGLAAHFAEIGASRDWYLADLDVWSVPGQAELSQQVANTVKASLMLLHSVGS